MSQEMTFAAERCSRLLEQISVIYKEDPVITGTKPLYYVGHQRDLREIPTELWEYIYSLQTLQNLLVLGLLLIKNV